MTIITAPTPLAPPSYNPPLDIVSIGAEWLSERAGGLNRYTSDLSRGFAQAGASQTWLVMGEPDRLRDEPLDVRTVACPNANLISRLRAMRRCFRQRRVEQPDVIASHFALYAYPLCRQLDNLPHVFHFHGPWADESIAEGESRIAVRVKQHMERSVYRTADRFITLSDAFAGILNQRYGVPPDRIHVVPGGVDCDRFNTGHSRVSAREVLGWDVNRPLVLCVRRLVKRMGIERLVEAVAIARRSTPDVLLLIAGKGPLEDTLREQIQQRGLGDHVRLLGFVADDDLPCAYAAADVSIVPSQSLEGFGLITLESLAAGTPALVTPVGGLPEVVGGLSQDLVMEGVDVASIASRLTDVLQQKLPLPSREACQGYVRSHFDWNVIVQRVFAVYQQAIDDYA